MEKKMIVAEGSGIGADTIEVAVLEDGKELFKKKYAYGYDVSWCAPEKDKPLKADLLASIAQTYGIAIESIQYVEGRNVFKECLEAK